MIDKRVFTGGINNDGAFEYIENGDYRYALNVVNMSSDNEDAVLNNTGIGHVETMRGNTKVLNIDIPLQTNENYKVVGSYQDQLSNSIFYFVSNLKYEDDNCSPISVVDDRQCVSFGNNLNYALDTAEDFYDLYGRYTNEDFDNYSNANGHRILRYWIAENRIETVLISKWLNFSPNFLITGINLVIKEFGDGDNTEQKYRQELLYWSDMFNPPRKLNIQKATNFTKSWIANGFAYGNSEDGYNRLNDYTLVRNLTNNDLEWIQILDAVKYPPRKSPDISVVTDENYNKNHLHERMFQFCYRYVYDDYEKSAWSPISEIALRYDEVIDGNVLITPNPNKDNLITVRLETGSLLAQKIELAVRNTNIGDLYLVDVLDKRKNEIKDNTYYIYKFYNNRILKAVEKDNNGAGYKLFDNLPHLAKAQEYIDGNRIAYGNIVEGFDTDDIKLEVELEYSRNEIQTSLAGLTAVAVSGGVQDDLQIVQTAGISAGQTFHFEDATWGISFDYTINQADIDSNGFLLYGETPLNLYLTDVYADAGYFDVTVSGNSGSSCGGIEVEDGYLTYGNYGAGFRTYFYDSDPSAGCNPSSGHILTPVITVASDQLEVKYTGFKTGATHAFGIVYYDRANRSCTTLQTNNSDSGIVQNPTFYSEVYVPFDTELGLPSDPLNQAYYSIKWRINHKPPCWATHYQWVYAGNREIKKFIQFTIYGASIKNNNTTSDFTEWEIDIQTIKDYQQLDYQDSILLYTYTKGDRVRPLRKFDTTTLFFENIGQYYDFEVTGFDDAINKLTIRMYDNTFAFEQGDIIEIYSPYLASDEEDSIYYEFSQEYQILVDWSTGEHYHQGEIADQSVGTPATGEFKRGDVYMKRRPMRTVDAPTSNYITTLAYVEDYNWSDFYISDYWDKGRPNLIGANNTNINGNEDFRRVHKPTTIYYSQRFIPATNINGLSSYPDLAFEDYDLSKGSIQLLKSTDRRLLCFQELKVGQIPVNERLTGTTSGVVTTQVDRVLNEVVYYLGDYGIGRHPESYAQFGSASYFVDIYRGEVLRLSQDGLTPLAFTYNMSNFITNKFAKIKDWETLYREKVNVYGVFYNRHKQYQFCVENMNKCFEDGGNLQLFDSLFLPNEPKHFVLGFNERINKFASFYSYNNEGMCSSKDSIVTFKEGNIYTHETSQLYATFYSEFVPSEVWAVSNTGASDVKIYEAISQENNANQYFDRELVWEVYQMHNSQDQNSNLIEEDFEFDEGKWYAPMWKDTNTPDVEFPLMNGDEIRDVYLMTKFIANTQRLARLFAVNYHVIQSDRHNT